MTTYNFFDSSDIGFINQTTHVQMIKNLNHNIHKTVKKSTFKNVYQFGN